MKKGIQNQYTSNMAARGFKLQLLVEESPAEILSKLSFNIFEFINLLENPEITMDETILAVKTLNKICEVSENVDKVLKCLNEILTAESFFQNIVQVMDIYSHDPTPDIVLNIMTLVKNFLQKLPSQSLMPLIPIISMTQAFISKLERDGDQSGLLQDIQTEFQSIEEIKKEVIETMRKVKTMASGHREEVPPEDFRTLSVIPTPKDVKSRARPFIRKNVIQGQYKDVDDYLDIQFRLLREDLVAPLRNGVQLLMKKKERREKIQRQDLQDISVYEGVRLLEPVATSKGVMLRVYFRVSDFRQVNWETSKRLIFGSLLCLSSDNFKTMLFCSVADRNPADIKNGIFFVKMEGDIPSLNFDPDEIYTMVETSSYFEAYRYNLEGLQKTTAGTMPMKKYLLGIETKEVDQPAYLTLDSQYIIQKKRVKVLDLKTWPKEQETPFEKAQYKALQSALTKEFAVIQGPPGTGKTFLGLEIMKVLLHKYNKTCWKQKQNTRAVFGRQRMREPPGRQILIVCYTNHALDQFVEGILQFQKEGVIRIGGGSKKENEALKECFIQNYQKKIVVPEIREMKRLIGPLMKENKDKEEEFNSKIQMLIKSKNSIFNEAALEKRIDPRHYESLIRSRKKGIWAMEKWLILDEKLTPQHLTQVNQDETDQADERKLDAETFADAMSNERLIHGKDDSSEATKTYKRIYKSAFSVENDTRYIIIHKAELENHGKQSMVMKRLRITRPLCQKLLKRMNETQRMNHSEVHRITNVWSLSMDDRWRLYRYWIHIICTQIINLTHTEKQYRENISQLNEIHSQIDVMTMRTADVIAMTTTGAAKYSRVLRELKPAIVIVEEAAEVLEAHIVTSLSEGCEHLILIGDHKQLKPKPTVYQLARQYHLDVSLFERMIKNGMHCDTLNIQHRMREEICALLVPYIYTDLTNHESVYKYPDVMGITRNMFFFNHEHLEDNKGEGTSHSNLFEATFIVKLAYYFMLQGYSADRITILTTYLGQLFTIRRIVGQDIKMGPHIHELKITAVDNYQGEENDIVLLSLVRSNEENKVGFLNVSNRVCVGLSRAKIGFYVVGNMAQLEAASPLWKKIISDLKPKGSVVDALPLACHNHPENRIDAKNPEDFAKAPEGGCMKSCDFRLFCGHVCERKCHPIDPKHELTVCMKPCQKECDLGHLCPKLCHEDCGKCLIIVADREWPCGHILTTFCYRRPDNFGCNEIVEKELPCQHRHNMQCSQEVETYPCNELTDLKLVCEHVVSMKCYLARRYRKRGILGEVEITGQDIDIDKTRSKSQGARSILEIGNYDVPKPSLYSPYLAAECKVSFLKGYRCVESIAITLKCEHVVQVKCEVVRYQTLEGFMKSYVCEEMVDKELPCKHQTVKMKCCDNAESFKCHTACEYELGCGHITKIDCYLKKKVSNEPVLNREYEGRLDNETSFTRDEIQNLRCKEIISVTLKCGHLMKEKCDIVRKTPRFIQETVDCKCLVDLELCCGHFIKAKCYLAKHYTDSASGNSYTLDLKVSYLQRGSPDQGLMCDQVFIVVPPCGHSIGLKCTDLYNYFRSSSEYFGIAMATYSGKMSPILHFLMEKRCPGGAAECSLKEETHLHLLESEGGSFQIETSRKCMESVEVTLSCNHVKALECHQVKEATMTSDSVFLKINETNEPDTTNTKPKEEGVADKEAIKSKIKSLTKGSIFFCNKMVKIQLYCKHKRTSSFVPCSEAQMYQLITKAFQENMFDFPLGEEQFKACLGAIAFKCQTKITDKLRCGHQQTLTCSEHLIRRVLRQFSIAIDDTCKTMMTLQCPIDVKSHTRQVVCSDNTTVTKCPFGCEEVLTCGHKCPGQCGECFYSGDHPTCKLPCERQLLCRHLCTKICCEVCPIICTDCSLRCPHRSNGKCKKPCISRCEHSKCKKECWEVCEELCKKSLPCGDRCPGFCGEPCTLQCLKCHVRYFDKMLRKVNKPPNKMFDFDYIQLPCGHTVEAQSFENQVDSPRAPSQRIQLPICPFCCKTIWFCQRVPKLKELIQDLRKVEKIQNMVGGKSPNVMVPCQKLVQFPDLKKEFENRSEEFSSFHCIVVALLYIQDMCQQLYKNGTMNFKTNLKITDKILSEKMRLATESLQKLNKGNWKSHMQQCLFKWIQLYSILHNIVKFKGLCVWSTGENMSQSSDRKKRAIHQETISKEIQQLLQYGVKSTSQMLDKLETNQPLPKPVEILRHRSSPASIGVCFGGTKWFKCNEGHLFSDLEHKDENMPVCRICKPNINTEETENTVKNTIQSSNEAKKGSSLSETNFQQNNTQHTNKKNKSTTEKSRGRKKPKESKQKYSITNDVVKTSSHDTKSCDGKEDPAQLKVSQHGGARPKEYSVKDSYQQTQKSQRMKESTFFTKNQNQPKNKDMRQGANLDVGGRDVTKDNPNTVMEFDNNEKGDKLGSLGKETNEEGADERARAEKLQENGDETILKKRAEMGFKARDRKSRGGRGSRGGSKRGNEENERGSNTGRGFIRGRGRGHRGKGRGSGGGRGGAI